MWVGSEGGECGWGVRVGRFGTPATYSHSLLWPQARNSCAFVTKITQKEVSLREGKGRGESEGGLVG